MLLALRSLLTRASSETCLALYRFVASWLGAHAPDESGGSKVAAAEADSVLAAASQVAGVFLEARPDLLKRGPATSLVAALRRLCQASLEPRAAPPLRGRRGGRPAADP